jgi:hypothetical protein
VWVVAQPLQSALLVLHGFSLAGALAVTNAFKLNGKTGSFSLHSLPTCATLAPSELASTFLLLVDISRLSTRHPLVENHRDGKAEFPMTGVG